MRQAAETAMSPQILEILIFVAVAAFLLFRLRGVLGTRTGHEDPNDGTRRPGFGRRPPRADESDVVIPLRPVPVEVEPPVEEVELPDLAALGVDDSLRKQLQALMRVEPEFTLDAFLAGSEHAYESILMAYENGDKERLRGMLSQDVFEDFEKVIDDRAGKGFIVDARFVRLKSTEPQRISLDESTKRAEIAVTFIAELITSVRDAEGKVVEGDPNSIRTQKDHWVFERVFGTRDPNWTLVET